MMRSNWFRVEDPGNNGFPSSSSPRIHPILHMSTPFVYLMVVHVSKQFYNTGVNCCLSTKRVKEWQNQLSLRKKNPSHLCDASSISGARYHLVATYSVRLGSPCSSTVICDSDRAKPKSQILTKHSPSRSTLDGCKRSGTRSGTTAVLTNHT